MKYGSEDTSACLPKNRKNHVSKPEIGVRSDGLQVLKISQKSRIFGKTLVSNGQRRATADFQRDAFLFCFLLGTQSSSRGMSIGMIEIFPCSK